MSGPLSLFSEADKQALSIPLEMVHDSFSRTIVVYKTADRVQISESANFNFFYAKDQAALEQSFEASYQEFQGVIHWGKTGGNNNYLNIRETIPAGMVRIKCRRDLIDYLEGVQYIEVDGRPCTIEGTPRPHGLFSVTVFSLYLREGK